MNGTNTISQWIRERIAPEATLERDELAKLADSLARERRFWAEHVRHDPEERYFHQLYRDPNLDVWLICWLDAQDTGYHDHDVSSGAVSIVEGVLSEDYLYRDEDGWIKEKTRQRTAGETWHFDASSIHGLRHAGGPPATSIHVYSPALWRMGHYEAGPLGLLRSSITYADETSAPSPQRV
jgi:predicted metal-dependent enzyme (double-stranded beta helix superfamily)